MLNTIFYIWVGFSIWYFGCLILDCFDVLRGHKIKEILRDYSVHKQLLIMLKSYYHCCLFDLLLYWGAILYIIFFFRFLSQQSYSLFCG